MEKRLKRICHRCVLECNFSPLVIECCCANGTIFVVQNFGKFKQVSPHCVFEKIPDKCHIAVVNFDFVSEALLSFGFGCKRRQRVHLNLRGKLYECLYCNTKRSRIQILTSLKTEMCTKASSSSELVLHVHQMFPNQLTHF